MSTKDFETNSQPRRRAKTAQVVAVLTLLASLLSCTQESEAPPIEPHPAPTPERIILILVDTLRRDHVSAYSRLGSNDGSATPAPAHTPNIDRIAEGGQLFTNAVSSFHATTMSVASLFTGLTPSIESTNDSKTVKWNTFVACGLSRFLENGTEDACIPNSVTTLAEDMQHAGYWTLGIVSNELLYRPNGYDRGFDSWIEVGLAKAGQDLDIFQASPIRTAAHVNLNVKAALAKRPSDRFFLYVHYLDVHDYGLFKRDYDENVERFDKQLGVLLDHLEAAGLLAGSTVILTSDHGEILDEKYANLETGRHFGNPALQPTLEIPLIVKPKTHLDSDVFIRSQDVRDLIRELTGFGDPIETELEADELFLSEMFYRTYRKGRWKSNWPRTNAEPLLFDLQSDPSETTNLGASPTEQHLVILATHRERITELSQLLAAQSDQVPVLDDYDVVRLRALGYIETTEESFGKHTSPPPQTDPKTP